MIARQFKRCSQCRQAEPLTALYRNAGTRDGRAGKCKECKKVYNATCYRDKNGPKRERPVPNRAGRCAFASVPSMNRQGNQRGVDPPLYLSPSSQI